MAKVIWGKGLGSTVTIAQYCNDWFTVKENHRVYSPTALRLDPDEMAMVLQNPCGTLLEEFEPHEDGTFTRRGWD